MEHGYLIIKDVVSWTSQAWDMQLKQIPGKRIMFRGTAKDGKTMTLLTPQSALQPKGFFWVDITEVQYDVMNETDDGAIFFRFDYYSFVLVKWSELKKYLLPEYRYYTDQEKHHWKLYINAERIRINGNPDEMPIEIHRHIPEE